MALDTRSIDGLWGPWRRSCTWLGALALACAWGCGDDSNDKASGLAANRYAGCKTILPVGSDTEAIQTALIDAKTGSVICLADGTYAISSELSLSVNDVTLRGNPKDREAVVLDYTEQSEGKDALSVSSAGFTVEHLSLRNSHGNAIVVKGTERVTFRNLKVTWDAGSVTQNGAYAVYPVGSSDVLVEDCEVAGASDSGIYVGQSKNIIVRNNTVHGNVTGIEIENSDDALVTGNHLFDNTGGVLVFVLPNLEKKSGSNTLVEHNHIESNNRANFGAEGTTVSFVPPGVGILVLANDHTEIRNNDFTGNNTAGVLAISYSTYETICAVSGGTNCASTDSMTDPDLSKLYVHDNTFTDNGQDPDTLTAQLLGKNLENVLWDGRKPPSGIDEDQLCLGSKPTSVRQFGGQDGMYDDRKLDTTDPSAFGCSFSALFDKIVLPQDKDKPAQAR